MRKSVFPLTPGRADPQSASRPQCDALSHRLTNQIPASGQILLSAAVGLDCVFKVTHRRTGGYRPTQIIRHRQGFPSALISGLMAESLARQRDHGATKKGDRRESRQSEMVSAFAWRSATALAIRRKAGARASAPEVCFKPTTVFYPFPRNIATTRS